MTIDDATARLGLPFLRAGQAQKEVWHNEALLALDLLVQASVVAVGRNDPPASPAIGQAWVVGPAPLGAWQGRAAAVAGWTAGGWRFAPPVEGMAVWSAGDGLTARFTGSAWRLGEMAARQLSVEGRQVVGRQQPAIAAPAGGTTTDGEARAALSAVLEALRTHGLIAR